MVLIVGPLWSGKRTVAKRLLGCGDTDLPRHCVWDVQKLAYKEIDLEKTADELSVHEVVIATEIGGGVVPVDDAERAARERAGRLCCLLAERAETVLRVFCGIPIVLKGNLP